MAPVHTPGNPSGVASVATGATTGPRVEVRDASGQITAAGLVSSLVGQGAAAAAAPPQNYQGQLQPGQQLVTITGPDGAALPPVLIDKGEIRSGQAASLLMPQGSPLAASPVGPPQAPAAPVAPLSTVVPASSLATQIGALRANNALTLAQLAQLEALATGNAAALDVYKFLRLAIDGRTLLERAIGRDPAFAEALSDDTAKAAEWMEAFARLPEPKGRIASHKLAKQLYWPVGDGAYHLLAPLLSSPLAHAVHKRISEDRFSDAAKAARDARRAGKAHPEGYRDYPNLVIQSFGGSKPQNISQLNSERRGENYLLASVPPVWESPAIRPPLKIETVFSRYFERRREVRRLSDALKDFLRRVADSGTNIRIRETRADLVAELCGEALHMAAELRTYLAPGWTAGAECQLNLAEQCWLDPARGMGDEDFAAHGRRGDWKDEVCLRFGNWLNARLQTDKTHFGGLEALAWQSALGNELKLLREELDDE